MAQSRQIGQSSTHSKTPEETRIAEDKFLKFFIEEVRAIFEKAVRHYEKSADVFKSNDTLSNACEKHQAIISTLPIDIQLKLIFYTVYFGLEDTFNKLISILQPNISTLAILLNYETALPELTKFATTQIKDLIANLDPTIQKRVKTHFTTEKEKRLSDIKRAIRIRSNLVGFVETANGLLTHKKLNPNGAQLPIGNLDHKEYALEAETMDELCKILDAMLNHTVLAYYLHYCTYDTPKETSQLFYELEEQSKVIKPLLKKTFKLKDFADEHSSILLYPLIFGDLEFLNQFFSLFRASPEQFQTLMDKVKRLNKEIKREDIFLKLLSPQGDPKAIRKISKLLVAKLAEKTDKINPHLNRIKSLLMQLPIQTPKPNKEIKAEASAAAAAAAHQEKKEGPKIKDDTTNILLLDHNMSQSRQTVEYLFPGQFFENISNLDELAIFLKEMIANTVKAYHFFSTTSGTVDAARALRNALTLQRNFLMSLFEKNILKNGTFSKKHEIILEYVFIFPDFAFALNFLKSLKGFNRETDRIFKKLVQINNNFNRVSFFEDILKQIDSKNSNRVAKALAQEFQEQADKVHAGLEVGINLILATKNDVAQRQVEAKNASSFFQAQNNLDPTHFLELFRKEIFSLYEKAAAHFQQSTEEFNRDSALLDLCEKHEPAIRNLPFGSLIELINMAINFNLNDCLGTLILILQPNIPLLVSALNFEKFSPQKAKAFVNQVAKLSEKLDPRTLVRVSTHFETQKQMMRAGLISLIETRSKMTGFVEVALGLAGNADLNHSENPLSLGVLRSLNRYVTQPHNMKELCTLLDSMLHHTVLAYYNYYQKYREHKNQAMLFAELKEQFDYIEPFMKNTFNALKFGNQHSSILLYPLIFGDLEFITLVLDQLKTSPQTFQTFIKKFLDSNKILNRELIFENAIKEAGNATDTTTIAKKLAETLRPKTTELIPHLTKQRKSLKIPLIKKNESPKQPDVKAEEKEVSKYFHALNTVVCKRKLSLEYFLTDVRADVQGVKIEIQVHNIFKLARYSQSEVDPAYKVHSLEKKDLESLAKWIDDSKKDPLPQTIAKMLAQEIQQKNPRKAKVVAPYIGNISEAPADREKKQEPKIDKGALDTLFLNHCIDELSDKGTTDLCVKILRHAFSSVRAFSIDDVRKRERILALSSVKKPIRTSDKKMLAGNLAQIALNLFQKKPFKFILPEFESAGYFLKQKKKYRR